MIGSHNDINVLHRSPVFSRLAEGNAPLVNYGVMGPPYTKGYHLASGIYLEWPVFMKIHREHNQEKYKRLPKGCGASIWCFIVLLGHYSAPC
jgi:hypothetical protein